MGQAGDTTEAQITPEMIDAGVAELRSATFGQDLREVAVDLYLAMEVARSSPSLQRP
jgi:hypothetical protein